MLAGTTHFKPSVGLAPLSIRPMQLADEVVYRRLYAEVRAPELVYTGWSSADKSAFCESQYALQDHHYRTHYADFEQWSICVDESVIGRLYLATYFELLILMDITLEGAWRGKGFGTRILTDVLRQADSAMREMSLHVEPTNPARRLYQRLGFVEQPEQSEEAIYLEMRRAKKTPKSD